MSVRGDTTLLPLDYELDDVPLEDVTGIADIVMQFNSEGSDGAMTFKLTSQTNPITLDSTLGKYIIKLTQTQSLALPKTIKYQLSVKLTSGNEVYTSEIKSISRGELLRTSEV